jgi:hypothetical protein
MPPSFPALAPMPSTRPSYSIPPPPAPLPDPPAPKPLPLPSPVVHTRITALLLLFLSFLSPSLRRRFPAEPPIHHRACPTNSIPSRGTRRPSARPLLAFRSITPQEGWEHALLDLPEGEGQRLPYQGAQRNDMPLLAPRRPPNSPCFIMHLVRLVLTRSRCPQLPT